MSSSRRLTAGKLSPRIKLDDLFPEFFGAATDTDVEDVLDEAHVELRDDIEKQDRKNA